MDVGLTGFVGVGSVTDNMFPPGRFMFTYLSSIKCREFALTFFLATYMNLLLYVNPE